MGFWDDMNALAKAGRDLADRVLVEDDAEDSERVPNPRLRVVAPTLCLDCVCGRQFRWELRGNSTPEAMVAAVKAHLQACPEARSWANDNVRQLGAGR